MIQISLVHIRSEQAENQNFYFNQNLPPLFRFQYIYVFGQIKYIAFT